MLGFEQNEKQQNRFPSNEREKGVRHIEREGLSTTPRPPLSKDAARKVQPEHVATQGEL